MSGPRQLSQYRDLLQTQPSEDRIPVEAQFSAAFQTGGGTVFRSRPDRSWGPFNFLYNRGKTAGACQPHQDTSLKKE